MTHDKLPYEVRKNSNVINPNPVETIKISMTHDESLSKSEKRRIELTQPKMTHDELLAKIEELDGQSNSSVMGFNTYRLPKDNEEPFITTLDWYHQTAVESHKKDKAFNKLSLDVQTLKQALRAVVELTAKNVDKESFDRLDGYEIAMERVIQAIEKELK